MGAVCLVSASCEQGTKGWKRATENILSVPLQWQPWSDSRLSQEVCSKCCTKCCIHQFQLDPLSCAEVASDIDLAFRF